MKDDGVAIEAAKILKDDLFVLNIEVVIGETDCQSCFYLLGEDDFVIVLDALCIGAEPGSIHLYKLEDVLLQSSYSYMQHDMGLIELMKLYGGKYKGYIIGIEIADIGFGDELSTVLKDNLPQICSEIKNKLENIILEESKHA